ncbi:non-canonical purine NTP pyrophosphatase [Phytomonospora endophytica]|nr:non-canonical purine NTP pyrophosphatase [Phytomonospora endophytica]
MHTVSFVTGNAARLDDAREHLRALDVEITAVNLDLEEIQSTRVGDVAAHKARQAHRVLGSPVIVEGSGFIIDELAYPGPLVRPLLAATGARGVVALADLTRTRSARFESVLVYVAADGSSRTFSGTRRPGTVASVPIGENAAGIWAQLWRVFIPDGQRTTLAALDTETRDRLLADWRRESAFASLGKWLGEPN